MDRWMERKNERERGSGKDSVQCSDFWYKDRSRNWEGWKWDGAKVGNSKDATRRRYRRLLLKHSCSREASLSLRAHYTKTKAWHTLHLKLGVYRQRHLSAFHQLYRVSAVWVKDMTLGYFSWCSQHATEIRAAYNVQRIPEEGVGTLQWTKTFDLMLPLTLLKEMTTDH